MPTTPKFRSVRFLLQGHTQTFRSPLSNAIQTIELIGSRWLATYTLPPMQRARAAAWAAFLTRLNGRVGRFFAGDPSAETPRGVATGTPLVNGGSQTGTILATDGWTPNITGILLAGDYIAWDTPTSWREMHMIVADANSNASGQASFVITPPIRESPADNVPLIINSPTCVMMLGTDAEAAWDVDESLFYGLRFSAEEAFAPTVPIAEIVVSDSLTISISDISHIARILESSETIQVGLSDLSKLLVLAESSESIATGLSEVSDLVITTP